MTIAAALLEKLSVFIGARIGLHFPEERRPDLVRGIKAAAKELGCPTPEACIEMLTASPLSREQVEILAACLTIGETYFFREPKSFEILEANVLPELLRRRRQEKRLRIWSAGCATGEEPYSLAMLLTRMIPDLKNWKLTILATDINTEFLRKAARGIYGPWSFRETPAWAKERYFRKKAEGRYEILPQLREMVTFSYHNLAEGTGPSLATDTRAMDLILCRNVLMYFAAATQVRVIDKFYRSLVAGGWLIVSPCEASKALTAEFSAANLPGVTFYRKLSPKEKGQRIPAAVRPEGPLNLCPEPLPPPAPGVAQREVPQLPAKTPELAAEPEVPRQDAEAFTAARLLYEQGNYQEAEARLRESLPSGPEAPQAMALLAQIYANMGRLTEAGPWGEKAVAADKTNPAYHYLLATILGEQGKAEDAVAALNRALYLAPDFTVAYFLLGNLARRQGKMREAGKYFRNALVLLERQGRDDIVPGSGGLAAGRMIEIIRSLSSNLPSPLFAKEGKE